MNDQFISIDPSSSTPLYLQVERQLANFVESGTWPPGSRIPNETELCERFGVSRITVRQALGRLVARGMIVRGRGRGTFVRDTRLTAGARTVTSFTDELSKLGQKAGSRLLEAEECRSTPAISAGLQREQELDVYRILRLRTSDGEPIAVQQTWLVAERFPGLLDHLGPDVSVYRLLAERYGVAPREAAEVFRVAGVPAEYTSLLGVPATSHAFHATRVTFDAHGAFEYTTSVIRGDHYEIRLALRQQ